MSDDSDRPDACCPGCGTTWPAPRSMFFRRHCVRCGRDAIALAGDDGLEWYCVLDAEEPT